MPHPIGRLFGHSQQWLATVMAPYSDTVALSTATSIAIRGEQIIRRAVKGGTTSEHRPSVQWHEGGSGPPLLLLNGWTASGLVWPADVVRRLERQFHVLRIDARGTGWSRGAPMPFTIADLADDAIDVLHASGHERAVVAGLSMGGMVAQELAIRHPHAVSRLILVATRPPAPAHVGSPRSMMARATAAPPGGRRLDDHIRALWAGFTAPGFADAHPEIIDEIVAAVLARTTTRAGLYNQARAAVAWRGADRLRLVRTPTVVIHGNHDCLIPVGNGTRLAGLIRGARYIQLSHIGHLIPYEAPDAFAQIVEESDGIGSGE